MAVAVAEPRATLGAASTPPRHRRRGAHQSLRFVLHSLVVFATVFFFATLITFALQDLSGLSPAHLQLSESATPEQVAALEHEWGLDRPWIVQYADWLTGVLQGDLGNSWYNGASIAGLLASRAVISLSVAGLALVIGIVFGFVFGVLAAVFRTTWIDRTITAFTTFISVMPSFVVGIGLVAIFAVALGWFPSAGYVPLETGGVAAWLQHLWLPALALSFDTVADVARQMRAGLVGAYRDNYVTGAVVRGLGARRIFFVHVLRNGSGPALTVLGMKFPALLGGAVVTEAIFGLAGFGKFAADSASRGDVPAVQGVLVVAIVLVVLFNLLVNVFLVRLNPASARGV
jgi:peptide/nickel transport system permease protein